MTQVTKTDNRTITKLAKDIATMRKRVASAVRKHAKLQERISKLQADGRIVSIHKDAPIVAGVYNVWFVKAESLNTDPDAEWNWYYQVIFVEEHSVYQCSCEDVRYCDCKHITALSASFEKDAKRAAYVAMFDPHMIAC
jgi:hypothetical protein